VSTWVRLSRRAVLALAVAAAVRVHGGEGGQSWKAAIIGHTGRGNYGHGMDEVFTGVAGVEVVAVADPDEAGRQKAAQRSGAKRQYADYREMLEKERPGLVCVGPRWIGEHRDMAMAAIDAGAHVFCEKPFTPTLVQADDVLGAAGKKKLRIAVAHQIRLAPPVVYLKQKIAEGLIGDLQQIRAYGKQDARAGGEDMMVLGVHLFDLMRMFAGDPAACTASVQWKGHDITAADARRAEEEIGPIAGDLVEAQFAFGGGVTGTFTSRAKLREFSGHWGIELVGSRGAARILADIWPSVFFMKATAWEPGGRTDAWRAIEGDPGVNATAKERSALVANRRLVEDWLDAIAHDREPACSGYNAMKAIEMVMAVYRAALGGTRVALPLEERDHPLA